MPYHWGDIENPSVVVNLTDCGNLDYNGTVETWIDLWNKVSKFYNFDSDCSVSNYDWSYDSTIDDIIDVIKEIIFPLPFDNSDIGILLGDCIPSILIPDLDKRLRREKFRIFYVVEYSCKNDKMIAWVER